MSDVLARLLVDACLDDRAYAAFVVAYAVDHSTNALRRRRPEDATTECVVFDWLARLASDMEAVPTGKVRLDGGNALWVSRRVVLSLEALERRVGPDRANDVETVREWLRDGRARPASPSLARVLREMNFAGGLVERLVVDPDFDFGPRFGARRCLVSRLLRHARANGNPLPLMELRHANVFSGGRSMSPPLDERVRDAPPWTRTWDASPRDVDEIEKKFPGVLGPNALTTAGQRKFALVFFVAETTRARGSERRGFSGRGETSRFDENRVCR